MANNFTKFWLALLKLGNTEKERREFWNFYCFNHCSGIISSLLDRDELQEMRSRLGVSGLVADHNLTGRLHEFVAGFDDIPKDATNLPENFMEFMNFSEETFTEDISFSGRLMIGANFNKAIFCREAVFERAEFIGHTDFARTIFHMDQVCKAETSKKLVSFSKAKFHNLANFSTARFPAISKFQEVEFHQGVSFYKATFPGEFVRTDFNLAATSFWRVQFRGMAYFRKAIIGANVEFDYATMHQGANFKEAHFVSCARFHNCRFCSTTSFRKATFDRPPEFFETELHEDSDFGGIDWINAERTYNRFNRQDELKEDITVLSDDAMRAWARLALIMSQREKSEDRQIFFKLKMRAERRRDGIGFQSVLNWLYEMSTDFGWGIGRAFTVWSSQILVMSAALVGQAIYCSSCAAEGWQRCINYILHGLLLSFANSHHFLGLASGDGWLRGSRDMIMDSCRAVGYFGFIGTIQAVLGPILLFLVLLTIRNRFRLR